MFHVTRKRFTAYVVFYGSEHDGFWRIFTGRGWRHCCVVLPIYPDGRDLAAPVHSVCLNPLTWGIDMAHVPMHPTDVVAHELREGATAALSIPIDLDMKRLYVPRGLLTCVSLIKAVLGLSGGWYVWTPKHLCRFLLRNGGSLIGKSDEPLRTQDTQDTRSHG